MKYPAAFLSLLSTVGLSVYTLIPLQRVLSHTSHQQSTSATLVADTANAKSVPLYQGLSDYTYPISTKNPQTQRYFNQGLLLSYGFNHAEAARSFQAAAKLDPNCAMCYWGIALVLGPNINAAMEEEAVPQAWQALQKRSS